MHPDKEDPSISFSLLIPHPTRLNSSMTRIIIAALFAVILPTPMVAQENFALERKSIILGKLQTKLPKIALNNTTLDEAIEFLRLRSIELDRANPPQGVNFVITHPNPDKVIIKDLDLTKTTFTETLNAICLQTKTTYNVEEFAVVINPHTADIEKAPPAKEFIQRRWTTPATFLNFITPPAGKIQQMELPKLFEALGVPFPEGSAATHLSASQTLIVRNTQANLDVINQLVGASQNPGKMAMDQRAMNKIILGEVSFYNSTLSEAIMFLKLRSGGHAKIKIAGDNDKLADAVIKSLSLKNVPLPAALKYICQLTGTRYLQHGGDFIILPKEP
jgi:hypothetical protein